MNTQSMTSQVLEKVFQLTGDQHGQQIRCYQKQIRECIHECLILMDLQKSFVTPRNKNSFRKHDFQNCQSCNFQLKFSIKTSWNMQKSIVAFTFSVLHEKNVFLTNFVQKLNIVSLTENLVPRKIPMCRTQWHCSMFLLQIENIMLAKLEQRKSTFSVSVEVWYQD